MKARKMTALLAAAMMVGSLAASAAAAEGETELEFWTFTEHFMRQWQKNGTRLTRISRSQ